MTRWRRTHRGQRQRLRERAISLKKRRKAKKSRREINRVGAAMIAPAVVIAIIGGPLAVWVAIWYSLFTSVFLLLGFFLDIRYPA